MDLAALETPLTVAVRLSKPKSIIMVLVAGGAHLDYRAADSSTPLHKAAVSGNYEAIKVILKPLEKCLYCSFLSPLT